ncbi:hypothetical protein PWF76_10160 [Streptococcus suis]|uniref:hypothetical protein n=1 Tax=Streptococcus suis TaxID=1307 RepID=UPI000CF4AC28|nr:hypothetical protein [Streptococcus suis]MDE1693045.1 hypothetical protein [Streptococcus suis]MDE3734741.1 hypothetical protein [Streptococcus suis]
MSFDETKFEPTLLENKDYQYIRLSIDSLSDTDKDFIRNNLLEISSGRDSELNLVSEATELVEYLAGLDINKRNGAIAEFLLICILREKGFSQEYCFKNLEENSAKKGFDGLVIKENQFWLVESKSSQINHGNSHRNTIYRAYSGLKKQLSGANKKINNPWRNAYNHARSAMSNKGLQKILASLSNSYTEKNFSTIDEHNVVIGSTVIPDNMTNNRVIATISDIDSSIESIDNYIKNHKSKNELVVIINLQTIEIVLNFFKEIADGR